MRPINLKIKGINSYITSQEIKFDKLSESKLFGIFGETGSGKTTILDSIVLALYGTSDRESIQNIINVNCKSAYIHFIFEVNNANTTKQYLVVREYKVRDSGVKTDAILTDLSTNKVIAEMTDNVNAKILELVGIGKKEFNKCVALPQNEFDKFLIDTPANRKKTIAKLFNLEHFGVQLTDKLKARKDIVSLKKLNVEDKLKLYDGVNSDKVAELKSTNKTLLNDLTKLQEDKAKAQMDYDVLTHDFETNNKLIDYMAQLTVKKSELEEIKKLKEQVEYTEKYGNILIYLNRQTTYQKELDALKPKLKEQKALFEDNQKNTNNCIDELSKIIELQSQLENNLSKKQSELNQYNSLTDKMVIYQKQIDELDESVKVINTSIKELLKLVKEYKSTIDSSEQNKAKLVLSKEANQKVIEKLRDSKTLSTLEDFVEYLMYLKSIIKPDSLKEVYQYNVFKEINKMIDEINSFELSKRKEISKIKNQYDAFLQYNKDLSTASRTLESKNEQLIATIESINIKIEKAKVTLTTATAQIDEKQKQIQEKVEKIKSLQFQVDVIQKELNTFGDMTLTKTIQNQLEEVIEKHNLVVKTINGYTDEKNNLLVNIQVNTTNCENLEQELEEINNCLRTLNIKVKTNDTINANLFLKGEELTVAKKRVDDFDQSVSMLTEIIDELKGQSKHKHVSKEMLALAKMSIEKLNDKESQIKISIALNEQNLVTLKEKLKEVKKINKEHVVITKEYDTILELSNLLQNGSLVDYVSEEYMYLVTDFANKYVYKISKGKYLLKYDGEFYVLDNFNGGINRGVKTLSGGERFIISLSLALGISQSIATSNNKDFNFFFIDEGFGSLSDNYIENVLFAFEQLMKMGFTVGFISHVEKMQNYINNRIIVTKSSNDEGSIIHQYF